MDYAACNVVYVDRAAPEDKLVKREDLISSAFTPSPLNHVQDQSGDLGRAALNDNLQTLLGMFNEVHVCTSGKSCASKLSELNQASIVELIPTLVLIDIPYDDELAEGSPGENRPASPNSRLQVDNTHNDLHIGDAYGLNLLRYITSEIEYQSLSKLVVPIALVPTSDASDAAIPQHSNGSKPDEQPLTDPFKPNTERQTDLITTLDQTRTIKYLDAGAVDVVTTPLSQERLPSLGINAYRAHRDASKDQRALLNIKRGRKRSWVGVDDQKPYAYLREAMVSGLMDGICTLGAYDEPPSPVRISVAMDRQKRVAEAIGTWAFSAHEFTDDELLHAALLMLQHALSMPELEQWRVSAESLTGFLVASRSAYNAFVPYHNFRHVVDVLQATFHFLVRLGRLPEYPLASHPRIVNSSPIASLIRPFEALTLLITAIGHDVGHPGVNNTFLVTLNAPLAQLYNDRSVLESFHCAAYSQILRRHWPAAFQASEMRQLMINSILATDMGLHFDYMKRLGWMQEKLHDGGDNTDGWNGRLLEDQRTLACSLLIKCADISNVARKYDVARQWTMILTDEFSRQASMEQDLGIPSALYAAPVREIVELGKSQIGFMNMFAIPLFQGVTDVMPAMEFTVNELHLNKSTWEAKIQEEQAKARQDSDDSGPIDGVFSPRTMSLATFSTASHHKSNTTPSTARSSNDSEIRIKALLNKSPFSPPNGSLEESAELVHHPSLPGFSTTSPTDSNPSPSEPTSDTALRSSKPSHVQVNHNHQNTSSLSNEVKEVYANESDEYLSGFVKAESATTSDPLLNAHVNETVHQDIQRGSDTTDGSNSAETESASRATSTTTNHMPLSPASRGTSIKSDMSLEKSHTPTPGVHRRATPPTSSSTSTPVNGSPDDVSSRSESNERGGAFMGTVRNLRKKPSRFRVNSLNFWRKNKNDNSSVPAEVRDKLAPGSEDDVNQWS